MNNNGPFIGLTIDNNGPSISWTMTYNGLSGCCGERERERTSEREGALKKCKGEFVSVRLGRYATRMLHSCAGGHVCRPCQPLLLYSGALVRNGKGMQDHIERGLWLIPTRACATRTCLPTRLGPACKGGGPSAARQRHQRLGLAHGCT